MSVDLEKILRPVESPMTPYEPKYMMLASGESVVVRQVFRDEIPDLLKHVEPLIHVERDYYDGPYTRRHNHPLRTFQSPVIPGDSAVIELYLPPEVDFVPKLVVRSVSYGYRDFRGVSRVPYRDGRSLPPR